MQIPSESQLRKDTLEAVALAGVLGSCWSSVVRRPHGSYVYHV